MERYLTLSGVIILAGLVGYVAGRSVSLEGMRDPPFVLRPDTRPLIPVVEFTGVQEGKVVGRMQGEVRVFWGEEMVIPDKSGAFLVSSDLLTEDVLVTVPFGMHVVSSRKGKYHYPIGSPRAERIVPENRLYFRTAEEAEKAGFLPAT